MISTTDRASWRRVAAAANRAVWHTDGRARWDRLAAVYLACLLVAGSYGLALLLPLFVKAAGGSVVQAGLIYWCGAAGAGGVLVLGGRLTERMGAGWGAAAGAGLYAVAASVLACGGALSATAYAAGFLLGAGWALFFTAAPIMVSSMAPPQKASTHLVVLAGFNALGMGVTPIAGQLLVTRGVSYAGVFALAALLSLCSSAVFCALARRVHPRGAPALTSGRRWGMTGPARLVLTSTARPFLLMVLLGACVFTTMTAYQVTFAASRGLSSSVFFACYTLGVIVPRFTVTSVLARWSPAAATAVLLAGMCLSLAGFLLTGHDPVLYAASSALLGVTYGLAYPLIQAGAADSAPGRLRHWALWYFSLAYFAGLYGFPLIAGTVIALGGYQDLLAVLLVIGVTELAISVMARRHATGTRQPVNEQERVNIR